MLRFNVPFYYRTFGKDKQAKLWKTCQHQKDGKYPLTTSRAFCYT